MNRHGYRNVFMLVLIALYVAGTGFIVLYGARFYRDMIARSTKDLQVNTALSYFNNRLKQNDMRGSIEIRDQEILVFKESENFILVYEFDGFLVEQNSLDDEVQSDSAQKIARLSEVRFEAKGNFVIVTFKDVNGEIHTISYALLSEGATS